MTEDEAKTKVCPMRPGPQKVEGFSVASGIGDDFNTGETAEFEDAKCIGSACMAWRAISPHAGRTRDVSIRDSPGVWKTLEDVRPHERSNERDPGGWEIERADASGYCGLAGAPQ